MKTWGSGGIAPPFLTLALVGGEWLASHPYRFTPRGTGRLLPSFSWGTCCLDLHGKGPVICFQDRHGYFWKRYDRSGTYNRGYCPYLLSSHSMVILQGQVRLEVQCPSCSSPKSASCCSRHGKLFHELNVVSYWSTICKLYLHGVQYELNQSS
jgi:hypothetical protein